MWLEHPMQISWKRSCSETKTITKNNTGSAQLSKILHIQAEIYARQIIISIVLFRFLPRGSEFLLFPTRGPAVKNVSEVFDSTCQPHLLMGKTELKSEQEPWYHSNENTAPAEQELIQVSREVTVVVISFKSHTSKFYFFGCYPTLLKLVQRHLFTWNQYLSVDVSLMIRIIREVLLESKAFLTKLPF